MKRLLVFAILISTRLSLAESPEPVAATGAKAAEDQVRRELIVKLAAKDEKQSKFSRARLPPQERRVRMIDAQAKTDATGAAFYTFAIDQRHGMHPLGNDEGWRLGAITGCVYENGDVFVQSGDRHRPAAFLLGKNLKPVAEATCHEGAGS